MEEAQWTLHESPTGEPSKMFYSRPLLGSELFADQVMLSGDGFGECCMGITFTSTLTRGAVCVAVRLALARLRFFAPLTAASLQQGIHDPQLRSWVYSPVHNSEELQTWVSETLIVPDDPVDPSQFIQNMNASKLPYTLPDGRSQHLRVYLIRPTSALNAFGIFMHGTHALMDAHPTMVALKLLLQYMSSTELPDVMDLPWGSEWENLPAGPITSTGGARPEWDVDGKILLAKIAATYGNPTPPHSLRFNLGDVTCRGRPRRVIVELTRGETGAIQEVLKKQGYTSTHLMHAAVAIATYNLNPVAPDDSNEAHITFGSSVISIARNVVSPHREKSGFVSRMVLVSVTVRWRDVSHLVDENARLQVAMESLKEQYAEYLGNPCTPQLMAEQMRLAPPREGMPMANPYVSTVSNLGNVEGVLPVLWPERTAGGARQDLPPLFRVGGLHFGHRITLPTPMIHIWTMHGQLVVQMQATDNWDEDILQDYMREIVRLILMVGRQ